MIIPVVAATDERDDSVMQAVSDNGARQGWLWGISKERLYLPARQRRMCSSHLDVCSFVNHVESSSCIEESKKMVKEARRW